MNSTDRGMTAYMLENILNDGFAALGLELDARAAARYREYYERLTQANRVMNLTAIEGEEDTARLHFIDCAAVLTAADMRGKRVIDVGTGAGFPGLAVKIAQPDMSLTLLDSLDKRVGFLREVCDALALEGVECVHARAEEAAADRRESYDIALSRAVARLDLLCELCLPYVSPGGLFIAMKGPDVGEELSAAGRAISMLGGRAEKPRRYTIPGTDICHTLVIIKKERPTPMKYPRRWAQIKKQPL